MNITEYLVSHGYGTVVWTTLVFTLLFIILAKFAWKPILTAVQNRESEISEALLAAKQAQADVAKMKADKDQILKIGREERDKMIREAKQTVQTMIDVATTQAQLESARILQDAKRKVEIETRAAVQELRAIVANVSLQIAEQILEEHLGNESEQQKLIRKNIDNIHFN